MQPSVQLSQYKPSAGYHPGASLPKQVLWYYLGSPLVESRWVPLSGLKVWLLRQFGATIGSGVRIKQSVRIKFPWRLTIGDHCWIGEDTWIDNLAAITLERDVCLSQGVYLCTGNHDWSKPTFDLRLGAITIKHSAWIGARAVVGPGVTVGEGAILTLGSIGSYSLESWTIYTGNPAKAVKPRVISSS